MTRTKDLGLSITQAQHGIQTAVGYEIESGQSTDTTKKHLRVGIKMAMVGDAALARLLIEKGIITEAEYTEALRIELNTELATYEAQHGNKIKFR